MTGPAGESPQLVQIAEHAAALYALEQAAQAASAGPLRAAVRTLLGFMTRQWVSVFGSTSRKANPVGLVRFVGDVRGELRAIRPNAATVLARYAVQARQLGVEQAVREVALSVDLAGVLSDDLPDDVQDALDAIDEDIAGHLDAADRAFVDLPDDASFTEAMGAYSHANRAATTAERAAAWVTNRSANDGASAVADELGVERIWIAERDGCVHCLGLSGETSVDGVFDHTETFGTKPLAVWPGPDLMSPPRHPNCRCRTQPWLGTRDSANGMDLREALRREAARSILTGWRLPSESERVRLGAAEDLLLSGTTLPSTVQARARAAVQRGSFDTFPRIKAGSRR